MKCGQKSASGILYPKIAVHSCCFLPLPVAPTTPVERRLFDCYELGDVIGNGGFGSVYSGTSRATGDTVSPQGRHWTGQGQDMTQLNTCSSAWSCNCYLGMLSVTVLHTLQVAVKIIPKSKVFSWSKVSQQWRPVVGLVSRLFSVCVCVCVWQPELHGLEVHVVPFTCYCIVWEYCCK